MTSIRTSPALSPQISSLRSAVDRPAIAPRAEIVPVRGMASDEFVMGGPRGSAPLPGDRFEIPAGPMLPPEVLRGLDLLRGAPDRTPGIGTPVVHNLGRDRPA